MKKRFNPFLLWSFGFCFLSLTTPVLLSQTTVPTQSDEFQVLMPEPRRVRQPIHEYFTVLEPQAGHRIQSQAPHLNPFVNYTHLGTDFGFIGEADQGLGWETGKVKVEFAPDQWGGMWHSLAGLAGEKIRTLNFQACYPDFIASRYQPKVVGLELRIQGQGRYKLELKDANDAVLWDHRIEVDSPDFQEHHLDLTEVNLKAVKLLNWIAEPGTNGSVDRVSLIIQTPEVDYDVSVFVSSLVKLSRSYDETSGLVKDRAHVLGGEFDNIPASGAYALATALGAHHGLVELGYAKRVVRGIIHRVAEIPTVKGILPHFVRLNSHDRYEIVPGTEYSTVDTSLYYHAALLACDILEDEGSKAALLTQMNALDLQGVLNDESMIPHGWKPDGVTLLPSVWRDWGGESALVVAMGAMGPQPVKAEMAQDGKVHEGIGFISELQSLFYPHFDEPRPDRVSQQQWKKIRVKQLEQQKTYFGAQWPGSRAAVLGFYGLSAGEARLGQGYMVSGVGLPQQAYIHPHYVLLSATLEKDPGTVYELLRRMEAEQLFPPWGLVENFHRDFEDYLAMQGSLNASFETLGAYHLLVKHRGQRNVLYDAARRNPSYQKAMQRFYPREGYSRAESGKSVGSP